MSVKADHVYIVIYSDNHHGSRCPECFAGWRESVANRTAIDFPFQRLNLEPDHSPVCGGCGHRVRRPRNAPAPPRVVVTRSGCQALLNGIDPAPVARGDNTQQSRMF